MKRSKSGIKKTVKVRYPYLNGPDFQSSFSRGKIYHFAYILSIKILAKNIDPTKAII